MITITARAADTISKLWIQNISKNFKNSQKFSKIFNFLDSSAILLMYF